AERDFRKEIELFPDEPTAYKNLTLLLVAQNRLDEATELLRSLVRESPTPPSYIAVCHVLDTLGDRQGVHYWAIQGLRRYPDNPTLRKLASGERLQFGRHPERKRRISRLQDSPYGDPALRSG